MFLSAIVFFFVRNSVINSVNTIADKKKNTIADENILHKYKIFYINVKYFRQTGTKVFSVNKQTVFVFSHKTKIIIIGTVFFVSKIFIPKKKLVKNLHNNCQYWDLQKNKPIESDYNAC